MGKAGRSGPSTTELLADLSIGRDGTVWVTTYESDDCRDSEGGECPDTLLMRLEDDGSLTIIDGWADVHDGDISMWSSTVSPDGDVWLIGTGHTGAPGGEVLLRFDGSTWEVLPLPEGFVNHPLDTALGFDPDGTLWVHAGGFARWDVPDLARFDDPGWTLFTVPGGQRSSVPSRDTLTIAADGTFWLPGKSFGSGCAGVAHYDGTTAIPFLDGSCVTDLALAPDGSVVAVRRSREPGPLLRHHPRGRGSSRVRTGTRAHRRR